ncbi:MAG: hypothetical protein U5J63_02110 [Fodinibius sp.]|nr:hypothetical protein [Fodinibius sp.]
MPNQDPDMNIFEWLFKSSNSGTTDNMDSPTASPSQFPPIVIILGFLVAHDGTGHPLYLAEFPTNWQQQWGLYLGICLGEITYLILGFFVQPQPDSDDMGWFGGLINNPFRISDNFNRFLLFLKILLLPGYLIARAILKFITLIAQRRQ